MGHKTQKLNQELIEHPIMEMIADKDFAGYLLTRFDIKVVEALPGDVQTAALIFQNGRFFIRVAQKFFEKLEPCERVAVLKHEVAHFIHKHYSRRNGREHTLWNIAADMAINQSIENLPKECVFPKDRWPANDAAEVYYELLVKEISKKQSNSRGNSKNTGKNAGENGGQIPDQFDDVMDAPVTEAGSAESLADDIIRETIKDRINAGDSVEKIRGLYAGAMSGYIDELTKPPMIDWRHALTRFAASLADVETRRSLKRPDRREIAPWGKKREYLPSLVIAVDTSGSVSDEMLSRFFSQIRLLQSMLNEIEVVVADATVQDHFTYKPGQEKKLYNAAKGRGGTDFDPAVQYINKNLFNCDGAIYLTDGWCPIPDTKCRIPMIWIVTDNEQFEGRPRIMVDNSKS